ncbi:MAG TPA: tripartite tricarboxylate transporter substrate binding protein [Burkholderiales bacterium]|nr:tripartite tricarboxylate transporter substrate binding protein [Burkholderiales bacterium]
MHAKLFRLLLFTAGILVVANVPAQSYPAKPVRIVVGFVPGGGSDFIARLVSQKLTEAFGRPVIVENRPGAGAAIATELVAKAPADGYTLLLGSAGPFGILPALSPKTPYDAIRDFDPITLVVIMPFVMTVHPSLPVKNIKDLIALARAKPGQLNFGSPGFGSTNHLANEMLKLMTHIDMTHVPYKGVSAAMADVMAGNIQILSGDLTTLLPPVKAGRLRAIAVTSGKRSSIAPEIPTIAESGVPGYDTSGWFGMVAPAGTPRAVIERLNSEMVKGITTAESRQRLGTLGGDVVANTPAEFSTFIRNDHAKWAKLIAATGLKDKS